MYLQFFFSGVNVNSKETLKYRYSQKTMTPLCMTVSIANGNACKITKLLLAAGMILILNKHSLNLVKALSNLLYPSIQLSCYINTFINKFFN